MPTGSTPAGFSTQSVDRHAATLRRSIANPDSDDSGLAREARFNPATGMTGLNTV